MEDAALIKLSLERILGKVEKLEKQNFKLKKRVKRMEEGKGEKEILSNSNNQKDDVLIDTKEVLAILGVCYNTLQAIIKKKLITPIRINQRRIRFSKQRILDYIRVKAESEAL